MALATLSASHLRDLLLSLLPYGPPPTPTTVIQHNHLTNSQIIPVLDNPLICSCFTQSKSQSRFFFFFEIIF